MHAIMKFRMRWRDRYECDVPHPLTLDGKYHMLCSCENKQSRFYKIPLEVNWNTYGTCVFQLMVYKVAGRYKCDTETHYILKILFSLSWS